MKKLLLTMLTICISTSIVYATGNPSDKYKRQDYSYSSTTQKPQTPALTPTQTTIEPERAEIESIVRQMLKAAENHQDTASYQMKLMKKGVTGMCPPQIISKRTPQCPPIKVTVNGKKLSGSKCSLTCYEYKGQQYDVGWCR